jgi:rhodanese-related sulfurtransferase
MGGIMSNPIVISAAFALILAASGFVLYKTSCFTSCPKDEFTAISQLEVKQISAMELKKELDSGVDVIVINVLSEKYFNDCRIRRSINIDYANIEKLAKSLGRNKNIVVYCASAQCPASREAYKKLASMGFANIRAYEGGIKEWHELGLPVEGACALPYLEAK